MQWLSIKQLVIFAVLIFFAGCYQDVTAPGDDENDNNDDPDPPTEYSHTEEPGASNRDFVTDEEFDELIIEIRFMPGMEPEPEALDYLREFLENHLEKSEITILDPEEIPSGGQPFYALDDLEELEEEHREQFTDGSTLAAFLLFVDGTFLGEEFEEPERLAISTFNTSAVFFGDTINRISSPLQFEPDKDFTESLVLTHQFGHLMGLVNNGTEMEEDHHDEPNGPHCTNNECLMHFLANSVEFFATQFPEEVPVLDEFCLDDLEALRSSSEQ